MMRVYAEYGAIGVVCSLFAYMIMNLIKSQKDQTDENTANHRIDIVKELNFVTDGLSYLKGRINGKS